MISIKVLAAMFVSLQFTDYALTLWWVSRWHDTPASCIENNPLVAPILFSWSLPVYKIVCSALVAGLVLLVAKRYPTPMLWGMRVACAILGINMVLNVFEVARTLL